MLETWALTLSSVFIISLFSLLGLVTFSLQVKKLKKIILFLVSFSTGALLGGAFIHLLPESIEAIGVTLYVSLALIVGIIVFFILEKFIHWRHCHIPTSKDHPHPLAVMNLVGDGLHNFIDGMIIAASFIIDTRLGITTSLAVMFHEIPQEIGDFGVLLHAGFSKTKALFYNFLTALTSVLGAILVFIMHPGQELVVQLLVPFTAGGFIYIAGSDLIPELHKETDPKKSALQLIGIIMGVLIMLLMLFV